LQVCYWALLVYIGAIKGCTRKSRRAKGVGGMGVGTQNKKPKKIWVIPVNTRGKK